MLNSNENRYCKRIYDLLYNAILNNSNKQTWCPLIRKLLCTLGYSDAWLFQTVGDEKLFLLNVKQCLEDQFLQSWFGRLNNSSRASLYKHIANHVFIVVIEKYPTHLSRLRVASHRLCRVHQLMNENSAFVTHLKTSTILC